MQLVPPGSLSTLYTVVDTSRENMADHGCNIRRAAVLYVAAACTTSTAASRITPTLQGSSDDVTTRSPIILSADTAKTLPADNGLSVSVGFI